MVIVIEGLRVRVDRPDDFTQFHIAAPPGTDVGAVLHGNGFGYGDDGEHAFVFEDAIRSAVAGQVAPGWDDGFVGMLRYAAQNGWLEDEGRSIRAHIERT